MGNVNNGSGDDNDKECRCQYNQIGNKERRIEEDEEESSQRYKLYTFNPLWGLRVGIRRIKWVGDNHTSHRWQHINTHTYILIIDQRLVLVHP